MLADSPVSLLLVAPVTAAGGSVICAALVGRALAAAIGAAMGFGMARARIGGSSGLCREKRSRGEQSNR